MSIGDTGTSSLSVVGFSLSGTAASDFAIASGTTCPMAGGSVAIGVSCTLNVSFTPTAVGMRAATLTIRDNAPGSPHIVNLVGTSTPGTPSLNWSVPAPIIYGTALNSTQLNATASVPGTFAYSPPLGAVLGAGSQTLSVTFTPADATDYITVTATVRVQVNRATLKITANNATKVFNTPNPRLTWTASGFVNGEGIGVLNTSPTCTTTATTTSPVGSYPITCFGAAAVNYTFTYVPGTLTVTCHYVTLAINPSIVALGGKITITGIVMSCTPAAQTISEKFTLTGPLGPSCSKISTVMFTTPQFTLAAGTSKTISFPFIVPKNACAGTYTTTATTLLGGIVIDGTSATLTVQ